MGYALIEASGEDDLQDLYLEIKNTFGISFVPNFFKMMANHHDVLKGLWKAYQKILFDGELPLQVKEVIFLYTALEKGCRYCSSIHLAVCSMLKVGTENLNGIKSDLNEVTPMELQLVLKLVRKVMYHPNDVDENDFQALKEMDFSDMEISEILCMSHLAQVAVGMAMTANLNEIEPEIFSYLKKEQLDPGVS